MVKVLLEKLQCSFWLISTSFNSPKDLFFFLTSHETFQRLVNQDVEIKYHEVEEIECHENEDGDLSRDTDDTDDISDIKIAKILKNCGCSKLFSWLLPFLKSALEVDLDAVNQVFYYVVPIIGKRSL